MLQTGSENNEAKIYTESGNEYEMNEIVVLVHEPDSVENKVETSPGIKSFL